MSAVLESPFVTEAPGLHPTVIRDIHHISIEGDEVRIFTIDKIPHPHGTEHRVNGDFIFKRNDLLRMMAFVADFLFRQATDHAVAAVREKVAVLRHLVH